MKEKIERIVFRKPTAEDGQRIHAMVEASPPLDQNSVYCNLLQASYFAETSILAERSGALAGFVTGFIKPAEPECLFVWQVAVNEAARGQSVATRMLAQLLQRLSEQVVRIETTVTPGNTASDRLFRSLAIALGTQLTTQVLFDSDKHFAGAHETEHLYRIGPWLPAHVQRLVQVLESPST